MWPKCECAISVYSAEQKEFLYYEGFLFELFTLDLPSAKRRLEKWRPNAPQPYWMAKRAAALAEVDTINNMEDQIRLALVETRKKSKTNGTNPRYLSVSGEAYQMLLLRYVKDAGIWVTDRLATQEEVQLGC